MVVHLSIRSLVDSLIFGSTACNACTVAVAKTGSDIAVPLLVFAAIASFVMSLEAELASLA